MLVIFTMAVLCDFRVVILLLFWLVEAGHGLIRAVGRFFFAALVGGGLCCLMPVAGWSRLVSVNFGRFWLVLAGFWFVLVCFG